MSAVSAPRRFRFAAVIVAVGALFASLMVATPAAADATASISGVVTSQSPFDTAYITLYNNGDYVEDISVPNGQTYTFTDVEPGAYTLYFDDGSEGSGELMGEWWNNQQYEEDADYFTVAEGATVTGKNAVLVAGASISGNVRGQATSTSIVDLVDESVTIRSVNSDYWDYTYTDEDGYYSFPNLIPGIYTIGFEADGYLSEWWQNKATQQQATPITVGEGATIDADATLERGASISGVVTSDASASTKIADVEVSAYTTRGESLGQAYTDSLGRYSITGLVPGEFKLSFDADDYVDEWWNNKATIGTATSFSVAANTDVVKSVSLSRGASIAGKITAGTGTTALAGVNVWASPKIGVEDHHATTNSAGNYVVYGLTPGDYTLSFSKDSDCWDDECTGTDYVDEWWNDASSWADATYFAVAANQAVTGKNAGLTPTVSSARGIITGTLTAGGSAVDYGTVGLVDEAGEPIDTESTDETGAFTFTGVVPGSYALRFSNDGVDNYLSEWSDGTWGTTPSGYFSVAGGQTLTKNADLELGASISGVVWGDAATDVALDEATIWVYSLSGEVLQTAGSDSDGAFTASGLPAGSYKLRFADESANVQFAPEYWNNAQTLASATAVTVAHQQQLTGISPVLPVGGSIEGTVLQQGSPDRALSAGEITLYNAAGEEAGWDRTSGTGTYRIGGLTAGEYTLHFGTYGDNVDGTLADEWWNNKPTRSASDRITVGSGQAVTGKDATLAPGATISGTVTNAANELLGVGIGVWKQDGSEYTEVTHSSTDGLGEYEIPGLTAGNYKVSFNDYSSDVGLTGYEGYFYEAEYWNNQPSLETAQSFTVGATGTVVKDAVLASKVALASLTATPTPTIAGTPRVGNTLTATTGTWTPAPVALSSSWLRDGVAIEPAQTGSTYSLTEADLGATISVAVTGTKSGYTPATKTSAPTTAVAEAAVGVLTPVTPVITGVATSNATLTAQVGEWSPAPDSFTYVWKVGTVIKTAFTGETYTVAAGDLGKSVTVTVTGHKSGYDSVSATSAGKVVGKAYTASPVPTVSGTPTVGQTLTAKSGTWKPAKVTLKYQWVRNGAAISGATKSTYKLTAVDATANVAVIVTGTKTGYATVARTSVAKLIGAALTATPTPKISGYAAVGETLTATSGTWAPDPVELSYQWKRSGVAIADAVEPTYLLTTADDAKSITVTVTGTRGGYTTVSKTSAAIKAGKGFTTVAAPVVSGAPTVGTKLVASTQAWAPAKVALTYQWKRNGRSIKKATKTAYTLTAADAGKTITLTVTGTKKGYTSKSLTSDALVIGKKLTVAVPKITGAPNINQTVTATVGAWEPAPVSFAYQWYRDGEAIDGATAATYDVTDSELGEPLTVRVTGSKTGYTSVTKTSAAVVPYFAQYVVLGDSPRIDGDATAGGTLTAHTGSWSVPPSTKVIQWKRNGIALAGKTGETYTPVAADTGKSITFTITSTYPNYHPLAVTTAAFVVGKAHASAPIPTITGEVNYGATLTAVPGAWSSGVTLSYSWRRDGKQISGATSSTYVFTPEDEGRNLTVVVTGKRTGYGTVTRESEPIFWS